MMLLDRSMQVLFKIWPPFYKSLESEHRKPLINLTIQGQPLKTEKLIVVDDTL
jgi:hypothetical protein